MTQARTVWAVWPAAAGPLRLVGPKNAVETLGPGWPLAVRAALALEPPETAEPRARPSVVLAVDCGAAAGLALAVLDAWAAGSTEGGVTLELILGDSASEAARRAIAARAGAMGAGTRVLGPVSAQDLNLLELGLDLGPGSTPAEIAVRVRTLAATRLG